MCRRRWNNVVVSSRLGNCIGKTHGVIPSIVSCKSYLTRFRFISHRSRVPEADPQVGRAVWQWRVSLDVLRLGRDILEGENTGIKLLPIIIGTYLFGHSNLSFHLFCIMQFRISVGYDVAFMRLLMSCGD